MKRSIALFIFVVVFASMLVVGLVFRSGNAGLVPNVQAEENRRCTNATLRGPYAAIQSGTHFDARGLTVGLGISTWDGRGGWSFVGTFVNQTGVSHATVSGTYTVNPDCTGSAVAEGGRTFEFVIIDGGKEIPALITSPDRVVTWLFKKQFPRHGDDEEN